MSQQEKVNNETVSFNQLRLLFLFMAADGKNDQAAIRRIELEASVLGIKFGLGSQTAQTVAAELSN